MTNEMWAGLLVIAANAIIWRWQRIHTKREIEAAIRKTDAETRLTDATATKTDMDAVTSCTEALKNLTSAYSEVSAQLDSYAKKVDMLEAQISDMKDENLKLREGVQKLINQIGDLGVHPVWTLFNL